MQLFPYHPKLKTSFSAWQSKNEETKIVEASGTFTGTKQYLDFITIMHFYTEIHYIHVIYCLGGPYWKNI